MNPAFLNVIGVTLVHFLWQGAVIGASVALLLWPTPSRRADIRYMIALAGLALFVLCPVLTLCWQISVMPHLVSSQVGTVASQGGGALLYGVTSAPTVRAWRAEDALPYLVLLWGIGVATLSCRLFVGLWQIREMVLRRSEKVSLDWQHRIEALGKRLGLTKPVRFLTSDYVDAPVTTGVFKSIVIVPCAFLAKMPTDVIEALLLHELAHIRRYDYLANVVQTVIETVLFYHPAVWWVSHVVRAERENCCDDLAVRALGSDIRYAKALTLLEEHRISMPMLAVPATGGHLMKRVQRILGLSSPQKLVSPTVPAAILVVAMAIALGGTVMAQNPPAPVAPKAITGKHHAKAPKAPVALIMPDRAMPAPAAPSGLGPFGPLPTAPPASLAGSSEPVVVTDDKGNLTLRADYTGSIPIAGNTAPVAPQATAPAAVFGGGSSQGAPAIPSQAMGGGSSRDLPPMPNQAAPSGMGGGSNAPVPALGSTQAAPAAMGGGGFGGGVAYNLPQASRGDRRPPAPPAGLGGGTSDSMAMPVIVNDNGTVNISFRNMEVDLAIQMLAQSSKISVVLTPGDYKLVTMTLNNQRPEDALRTIARSGGALVIEEGPIYKLIPDRPTQARDEGDLILEDTNFSRAALAVASKYGVSVSIPSGARFGKVTAKIGDVPLEVALQVLCESGGASYHIDKGVYFFVAKKGSN